MVLVLWYYILSKILFFLILFIYLPCQVLVVAFDIFTCGL